MRKGGKTFPFCPKSGVVHDVQWCPPPVLGDCISNNSSGNNMATVSDKADDDLEVDDAELLRLGSDWTGTAPLVPNTKVLGLLKP